MGQGSITKERIFQAALQTFAQHGYEGARMDKIAAEVGINKASLYFHFKSKEEIFHELFQYIIKNYRDKMKMIVTDHKDLPIKDRLKAIYTEYLEYNWGNSEMEFWNRVYYLPPSILRDEIFSVTSETKKEFVSDLVQIMEEGINRKELKELDAYDMANTFYYVLTCIDLSAGILDKEHALSDMEHCFEVIWTGIKGR
jgi:Transcriptional regulator